MRDVASRSMRRPELAEADRRALRHQHAALDGVIELADVARPRMIEQRLQRRRLEAGDVLAVALRVLRAGSAWPAPECPRAARAAAAAGSRSCSAGTADPGGSGRPPTSSPRFELVAETMRTLTCRVRDEPTRSKSPVSSTRSSFGCRFSGTLAISSRNSVPPSASSKRPTRSVLASVNAPFTWPNSSLSKTPFGQAAGVDRDEPLAGAARTRRESPARRCPCRCRSRR